MIVRFSFSLSVCAACLNSILFCSILFCSVLIRITSRGTDLIFLLVLTGVLVRESIRLALVDSREMRESNVLKGVWSTTAEAKREAKMRLGLQLNLNADDDPEQQEEVEEGNTQRTPLGKHFIQVPIATTSTNITGTTTRGSIIRRSASPTRLLDYILAQHSSNPTRATTTTTGEKDASGIAANEEELEPIAIAIAWYIVGILTAAEIVWMMYTHLEYTNVVRSLLTLSSLPFPSLPLPTSLFSSLPAAAI